MKKILALVLALTCCIASEAKATGQQSGINSQSTIPAKDFLIKNVTLCSAMTTTGTCAIFTNAYAWATHTFQIITTGSPTYVVTVSGCFDSLCANAPVLLATTGSTTATPLNLGAGGIYPFYLVNVPTLSTGSITIQQISTSDQASGDPSGRDLIGNSNRSSYHSTLNVTVPTAASSLAAIESDATSRVRLRGIRVCLGVGALQTTAGVRQIILFRSTAASSGGSTATPSILDSVTDIAFGGVLRSGAITTTPTGGSVTVANALWSGVIALGTAAPTAVVCANPVPSFFDLGQVKAPLANAGVANGLALADLTGGTGGTGSYTVDLDWTVEPN